MKGVRKLCISKSEFGHPVRVDVHDILVPRGRGRPTPKACPYGATKSRDAKRDESRQKISGERTLRSEEAEGSESENSRVTSLGRP